MNKKHVLLIVISYLSLNSQIPISATIFNKIVGSSKRTFENVKNRLKGSYENQLIKAIKENDLDEVESILTNPYSNEKSDIINYQDEKFKMTPLMYACTSADFTMVKYLLKYKPNLNLQNFNGNTALMEIFTNKNIEEAKKIFKILINTPGINLNLKNNKGQTVIIRAVIANNTNKEQSFIKELLIKKANLTITDKEGKKAMDHTNNPQLKKLLTPVKSTK